MAAILLPLAQHHLEGDIGLFEALGLPPQFGFLSLQFLLCGHDRGDVVMGDDHPVDPGIAVGHNPESIPAFFLRRVTGVLHEELLDLSLHHPPDPFGHPSRIDILLCARDLADGEIVDPDAVVGIRHAVAAAILPPGIVGFDNNATFIKDGDIRRNGIDHHLVQIIAGHEIVPPLRVALPVVIWPVGHGVKDEFAGHRAAAPRSPVESWEGRWNSRDRRRPPMMAGHRWISLLRQVCGWSGIRA
ncbi:MAG: hypothetical protein WBN83_07695 [Desulfoprunum sp.]